MFLDQRNARYFLRTLIKGGERVLDVFCHSGGFAISAKKAGAGEVIGVDISPLALELAKKNEKLNNLEGIKWVEANAFDFLKEQHKKRGKIRHRDNRPALLCQKPRCGGKRPKGL
jgi:23S rRNA (cytosine1962-C5)-methyltransferase